MSDGIQRNGVRAAGEEGTLDARTDVGAVQRDVGTAIETRPEVADLVHDQCCCMPTSSSDNQTVAMRRDMRSEEGRLRDCDCPNRDYGPG